MNTNPYRFISRPAIMILLAALASPGRLSSSFAIARANGMPRSGASWGAL